MSAISLLLTGVGAPGTPGTLYLLRKNPEGRPVRVIGVDSNARIGGRYLVDRFFLVPPPEDPGYLNAICSICDLESIRIVLPQTTRESAFLSSAKGFLSTKGIQVMVSDPPAVEVANNKWQLVQRFKQFGLPYPAAYLSTSEEELLSYSRELGYPEKAIVVKPPVSNGMRGVRIIRSEPWDVHRFLTEKPSGLETSLDELLRILRKGPGWPELLVMEYLPGPEYTVDAYIGNTLAIALPRLREVIRSGITFACKMECRDDISRYSLQAARQIGLRYAFGFQFKLDEAGVPRILESNPRIQGTMVASGFSGANLIWYAVKELLGERVEGSGLNLREAQFYRVWGGVGVGVAGEFIDEI